MFHVKRYDRKGRNLYFRRPLGYIDSVIKSSQQSNHAIAQLELKDNSRLLMSENDVHFECAKGRRDTQGSVKG